MTVEVIKPWYQQFWPWALIALPATAVVAGLYTYSLAASGSSGLVVDDYYKVGKAINHSLAKGQRAAELGLKANLALVGDSVRLLLDNPAVQNEQQLVLNFYHATMPDRDQSVLLLRGEAGTWDTQIKPLTAGKWYVDLTPMDGSWRLTGVLSNATTPTVALMPAQ